MRTSHSPGANLRLLALLASTLGALGCLWWAWCYFPQLAWNEVRLAPAFALRLGINPYPPIGGGPLSTWIYGPVGMLLNLPATLARDAIGALQIACLINFSLIIGPLACVLWGTAELRARGPVICGLALTLALLLVPSPNLVLQVADQAAVAFGVLSCWFLARHAEPRGWDLAAAAACSTLALWSKQTELFLCAGQVLYLLIVHRRRAALQFTAWLALGNGFALAAASTAFGFENLWLNLVVIPGHLPWADLPARLAMRPGAFVAQVVLPTLGLLLLWRRGSWPASASVRGRFFRISVMAFFALLPVGLTAYCKIGGDTNLLHSWSYLLPAIVLLGLADERGVAFRPGLLLAILACALAWQWPRLTALPARAHTQHLTMAGRLAAIFPGTLWFPQNPVTNYYADGRLWHTEDGIATRQMAGCGSTGSDFQEHLPPRLQAVAYPEQTRIYAVMSLLPDFTQRGTLPGWVVLTPPRPSLPPRE